MSIRSNVRERRQERLKQIQAELAEGRLPPSGYPTGRTAVAAAPADSDMRHPPRRDSVEAPVETEALPAAGETMDRKMPDEVYRLPPAEELYRTAERDERMNDPELVWKRKQQEMGWAAGPYERTSREYEARWREWNAPPSKGQFRFKLILCCLLFAAVWGVYRIQTPWAAVARDWVRVAMTHEMNFQAIEAWYQTTFQDTPSFIPAFHWHKTSSAAAGGIAGVAPVSGKVIQAYSADQPGVVLQTARGAQVKAYEQGWVIYAGPRQDTGFTVEIRHPGGMQTEYGLLSKSFVRMNDWVKGGEVIGNVSDQPADGTGRLYFRMTRNGQAVNPSDVIAFD